MKSKTIVLWGRDDLLSCSVELILTAQEGWRVVNISNKENIDVLIQTVDKVNPDVVIIYRGENAANLYLPTALFNNRPGLKVITASLQDNRMEVYSKHNISVNSTSEFISLINADSHNSIIQKGGDQGY